MHLPSPREIVLIAQQLVEAMMAATVAPAFSHGELSCGLQHEPLAGVDVEASMPLPISALAIHVRLARAHSVNLAQAVVLKQHHPVRPAVPTLQVHVGTL